MTRKIALHCMKSYSELHSDLCELCPIYGQTGSDHCFEDALQYVIGMLEQEPILDKIKDEIIKYECDCRLSVDEYPSCKQCTDNVFETIYGVLDKYKSETEVEDGNE